MNMGQLCKRAIVAIDAAATLRDAARLMRAQHVGALVVTSALDGRCDAVGVLTDRDIADAVASHDIAAAAETRVGAIASRPIRTVPAAAGAAQAAEAMLAAGVRRLIVVDDGALVGVVSSDDLLQALIEPLQALAASFRAGIAREEAARTTMPPASPRPVFLPMGTPGMRG